ncbi:MAG: hypothetical protein WC242_00370 [Candidatus Paceibacterota bacterium]|jgi:hypothetical protein
MWLPFYFNGHGPINSRDDWEKVLIEYLENSGIKRIKQARIDSHAKSSIPYFGLTARYDGNKTLGEWAKENGIDLDPSLALIDEILRYGYTSKEIRTIKRKLLYGLGDDQTARNTQEEEYLAIIHRTLPAYFLDQFRKLRNKPNLSDQSRVVYLRIILRKVLGSQLISDNITRNRIRQFIDTGSPLSVVNAITYRLENIVAKEGTKVKES